MHKTEFLIIRAETILFFFRICKIEKTLTSGTNSPLIRVFLSEFQCNICITYSSVLQLFGLHASMKCNFPSHKLCIFLYFSRFLPRSVPVTLLLSPKFPFWGDQNSHFDNNSPSLPLIGGIRFKIWGKNHPPKIQISNGS